MVEISWASLFIIIVMVLYASLSKRSARLPGIPLALFIAYFSLEFVIQILQGYAWSHEWLGYVEIAADILLSWAVARIVLWFFIEFLAKIRTDQDVLPKITRDFISFLTFAILFFVVLRIRSDVNLASLLTTSAVLTVVIGLAAQATLSNLFSGLIIQAERPFAIGDWIQFEGYEGTVIGISWKSTQVLTREKVLVYIPNSVLASSTFINYSRPNRKKIARLVIGLEYGAPPNLVKKVISEVLEQNPKVLKQPRYNIRLIEFSDFSIQYEIRFWHSNYAIEPQLKADINNQLWYALRRSNIRIPFPIRDVQHAHMEREHEKETHREVVEDIRAMLGRVPILSPLSESERADLARRVSIEAYGEGEIIVREGDDGDSMYIVRSGSCEAIKQGRRKQARVLSRFGVGDFFGEISLLTGEKRTATIQADQDTALIVVDKEAFSTVMSANADISEQIGKAVVERRQVDDLDFTETVELGTDSRKLIQKIKLFFGV